MAPKCDFSGWATKANLRCSDGRTIMKGAFEGNNGKKVPLVWNHAYNDPDNVLGHALLEAREDGVYAYGFFNSNPKSQAVKASLIHGDIVALSICANDLKQQGNFVSHGNIREVSLVLAGANPGAFIDTIINHGEAVDDAAIIYTGEPLCLMHSDDGKEDKPADDKPPAEEPPKEDKPKEGKEKETVKDIYDSLSDKQKEVVHNMLGRALEQGGDPEPQSDTDEGGKEIMKHNIFDREDGVQEPILTHADQMDILENARKTSVGTLQHAIKLYAEAHEDTLKHGIDDIEALFPEYKDLRPGAPELVTRDQGWVSVVMNKVHKSPISRIRTRNMDARSDDIRAHGYQKGKRKTPSGNMKLITRTTDPQTIYVTDSIHRDDIIDITDFDVVEYQYGVMRQYLNEEVATAIMIGDGREEGDEKKISEEHIRSIWNDDDLYTIHYDVDIDAARAEIQGSRTDQNFGENYIYAEAILTAALYSREKYKGTGTPDFFCTPHLVNVMLLARDMNGRRIYASKTDLTAALNCGAIYTAEQFEGLARTDADGKKHKLLGLFVNLADYTVGHTKGGEITRFNQFDIDFNQQKYLIETRLSGALTRLWSAVALEEPATTTTP